MSFEVFVITIRSHVEDDKKIVVGQCQSTNTIWVKSAVKSYVIR